MDEPKNQPVEQSQLLVDKPVPAADQPIESPATPPEAAPTPLPSAENASKKERPILSFVLIVALALGFMQLFIAFGFQSYKVFGSSMHPTLNDGDRLIISKVGRTISKLQRKTYVPTRGDVVVFVNPRQPDIQLIKRVIGLPGERVVVENGKLTVYNKQNPKGFDPDDAEYGKDLPATSGKADLTVPKGHIFVSGDNREGSNSLDSRNELGAIPEDNIVGTLKVRLWPFDNAKFY